MTQPWRSLLFVPATRPDRFDSALQSGADAVCLDLEDAVPHEAKEAARQHAARRLVDGVRGGPQLGVRINAFETRWAAADLAAVGNFAEFIIVPKAEDPALLSHAGRQSSSAVWALVETPVGLRRSWEIAHATRGLLFGAYDYAAAVGCEPEWEPLLFARATLAAACAAAGVELLDSPSAALDDLDGLRETTRRAKSLGFTGRACIHPTQVTPVHAVFTPTEAEVQAASEMLAAFSEGGGGAARWRGGFVDAPMAAAARRVLFRAGG